MKKTNRASVNTDSKMGYVNDPFPTLKPIPPAMGKKTEYLKMKIKSNPTSNAKK